MVEQDLHRQEFLIKLVDLIYANLGDENFGAKELAKAAGMSQRKLSHKLQTIKKTSVCRFICETRLQKAMEMLQTEDFTASEVAYKVGFASATYFNKCFHEFFGFPPGKIKKEGLDNPRELNPVKTRSYKLTGRSFLLKFGYAFAGLIILAGLYLLVSYFSTLKTSASASSSNTITPERSIAVLPFLKDSPNNEDKKIDAKPTKDLLAHSLSMKGDEMIKKWWDTRDDQYLNIASNFFNEAMKKDPEFVDAKAGKGGTYELLGMYDSAMIYYQGVLKIDRENRNALEGLGSIYMKTNKFDSAIKYFNKQLDTNPKDMWADLNLGMVLAFGKNEVLQALPFLQKAYDLGGSSKAVVLMNIGFVYFSIGEYSKALKYIRETLLLEPSWCGIDQNYYNIQYIQGNFNEALNFLDSIQNFTTCKRACDIMRFYYYTLQKDLKRAEGYSKQALNAAQSGFIQEDGYYDIYFNYLLNETGRKNDAAKGLQNSVKYYEAEMLKINGVQLSIVRLKLAASYAMLGENEKALEYLSQLEKFGLFEYPITLTFPGFDNLSNDPEFKAVVKRIEDQRAAIREKVREMEDSGELNL